MPTAKVTKNVSAATGGGNVLCSTLISIKTKAWLYSFRMNKFLMFFNIVKIYQSTQAVLNLAVFQFSFSYTKMKKGSRDG